MNHDEYSGEAAHIEAVVRHHALGTLGRDVSQLTPHEMMFALAGVVRERALECLTATEAAIHTQGAKRLYYLSMEYLPGRSLGNNLYNLGLLDACREALAAMGHSWEAIIESEEDAALGDGEVGRLAACILDSMASLGMPGYGYGINYEYGMFRQEIQEGAQKEKPERWLEFASPWEVERTAEACDVRMNGRIEHKFDKVGNYSPIWMDYRLITGVPYDMPVVGHGGRVVNFIRLFSARASHEFDIDIFNDGDYFRAVDQKITSEAITKVLYPTDSTESGKELHLIQEYFLVACAIQDILRRHEAEYGDCGDLAGKAAIQLNDTHPALAVAELMRTLIDEKGLEWDDAWATTRAVIGYTSHTLMLEAFEKWPAPLLERMVPRHMQIIFEVNRRFLDGLPSLWTKDPGRLARMSLIEETNPKQVRMAHLAVAGAHAVNGVTRIHSGMLQNQLLPDFHELEPSQFMNITNGVSHRRWIGFVNPGLAKLVTGAIGEGWIRDYSRMAELERFATDTGFLDAFRWVKHECKERLADRIHKLCGVKVDSTAMFDIHAKRIHEHKRQTLNIMNVAREYLRIVEDGVIPATPRVVIFSGKAAPGYWAAKQIIRLIHAVAETINADSRVAGALKVVFLPDYRVSLAECVIPAADLSEHISMAGSEASGTGNMKFAMNGSLIIGTWDGSNIEIAEAVGEDNIYMFGLTADKLGLMHGHNTYSAWRHYSQDEDTRRAVNAINSGLFCPRQPNLFSWFHQSLLDRNDPFFHLADFPGYVRSHGGAAADFADSGLWSRMAVRNIARSGGFSSDRAVHDYARLVWGVKPLLDGAGDGRET